jgi:DNA polymerase-3 subunit epsilon
MLFFDVETSGLPKKRRANYNDTDNWPRIIQLSWHVLPVLNRPLLDDIKNAIIIPDGFEIPADSIAIHGITNEYAINNGQKLNDVLDVFLNDTIRDNNVKYIICHNVEFDKHALLCEMVRCNRPQKEIDYLLTAVNWICTMTGTCDFCKMLPIQYGSYKYPKLSELYKKLFRKEMIGAHDAKYDVYNLILCVIKLHRRHGFFKYLKLK